MKTRFLTIFFLTVLIFTISGCSSQKSTTTSTYQVITAVQAKEMMDENSDIIILDVRTEDEFATGHIKNAILIPDTDIAEKAESTLTDKSSTILVYCRSGRRSAIASEELSKLGYTNIYDFGGITDWEYDIVTD
jgi:rhodanese-related sulfurtransferase